MSNKKNSRRVGMKCFSSFILIFSLTTSVLADFTKRADVVTDSKTGLEWQDDIVGGTVTWQEAIDYCEALNLSEYTDWRLPNINELKTIIDRSKSNPSIVDGFEKVSSNLYWSSSTFNGNEDNAWIVNFNYGYVDGNDKGINYYVRCVRDGQ